MTIISMQDKSISDVDAGVFTWELSKDKVYADRAVAALFDVNEGMAEKGLPITSFLERIDPRDRPRIAKSIHAAIVSGEPYQEDYRIIRSDGSVETVMALGRCFRDSNGDPSYYAGIVFPKADGAIGASTLFWHCLSAYEIAQREGHLVVAAHLRDAMKALERRTTLACMH